MNDPLGESRIPPTAPQVGDTLKRLRKEQGLTLERLAAKSGISRSMLSEIERNRSNPTFATVWRLSVALGTSIGTLLTVPGQRVEIEVVTDHATPVITSEDRRCVLRILGPIQSAGSFEWYHMKAEPGASLVSSPHVHGATEHLSVLEGRLEVESGDASASVAAGETARYRADVPHAIRNTGKVPAEALLVVAMS